MPYPAGVINRSEYLTTAAFILLPCSFIMVVSAVLHALGSCILRLPRW